MTHGLDSVAGRARSVSSVASKTDFAQTTAGASLWRSQKVALFTACLMAAAILAIFLVAPSEQTMGAVQRIVYIHVAVAWLGLMGFVVTAGAGLLYLVRRDLAWDHWSQSAAELGSLCTTLALVTGSLWASEAWNTWWTWEPRLTTAFVLWLIYCGYLVVRASLDDPHRRARTSAVLAILGLLDVPLVVMATRWFRGIHPVSPEMEPSMRAVLLFSAVSFTMFFAILLGRRAGLIRLESSLKSLERQLWRG